MAVSSVFHDVGEAVRVDFKRGPTPPGVRADTAEGHPPKARTLTSLFPRGQRIDGAVLAFVAIGVLLRLSHYLTNYPLWGDEAFLALSTAHSK